MKILISGAGVGGLALAGFLKDNPDFEVVLIDKAKDFQRGGFLIGLWSNGRRMLQKLGVGEKLDKAAVSVRKMCLHNEQGAQFCEYDLDEFYTRLGQGLVHVPRSDLYEWLFEAAGKPAVRMGRTITSLTKEAEGVSVVFDDQSTEHFDLVVGADGVHSEVRKLCFASDAEHFENWRVWWVWSKASLGEKHIAEEYVAPGRFMAVFNEDSRTLVTFFAKMDHTLWDEEADRIDRLKSLFKNELTSMPTLFDGVENKEVMPSDLSSISLRRWHSDHVVLLGDAAHAMVPFTSLGASLSLEDSYVLAGELMQTPHTISLALNRYEQKRRTRIARAERLTARLRMMDIESSSVVRRLIDTLVPFLPPRLAMRDYLSFMQKEL